ncbi:asparagine synthase (glutamine-hydrolyzing) [Streptomyces johnsoniae]|uniref:asparagine synthase (glutamine-hydrolyzing) n=1 Tax=Streptomyces johnsoniae TaxID=3075532 RepID=A0ABU2SDG9_9ACTN|nr:asparagine synthase (glutamine-hydrolyzing) [Streptomyces sp. DSM 41886]MDT0446464.1 asparagine synthase (glutamine-hydrolyzing) [Streptomyces sp. DSM 41886]
MCGITGWISFDRDLTREEADLAAMTATMACRGPDAEGTWLARHAALGHRRLAVIDLAGGAQPMVVDTPDGPVAMTYSGEAYNFTELRDELRRRGHAFRTASDTEVVLRGYVEWGPALADRLNGMYALGIWDGRTDRLVLIRDRLGIKPLYYHPTDDGVLFGSEAKAILAHPLVEPVIDTDGFRELFGFVKTPGAAVWSGMREVRPGAVVTVDRAGLREHVYWKLAVTEHRDDTDTTVAHIGELLDDIVTRQLVADVPLCVLLSGGLDSSALTALAARAMRERGERARSFTVDYEQRGDFAPDELRGSRDAPFARELVAHVGTEHHDIRLDHRELADPGVRAATVTARDLPFGFGEADNSLYLLFRAIREHSTVALSGESADEVFGGYPWFHLPVVQQAAMFPWVTASGLDPSGHPTKLIDPDLLLSTLDIPGYWAQRYAEAVAEVPGPDGEDPHERRMREFCYVHLTSLLGMLLDRKDRMSMAVGLEVRVPFCDHRLVEYVFNTPWSMKTFDGREKSLLRSAVRGLLPASVADRRKALYPKTQDPRYVTALQRQVADLLSAAHPAADYFDRDALRTAAAGPPEAVHRDAREAFERVLDLATWLDVRRPVIKLS